MKFRIQNLLLVLMLASIFASCTSVPPGHKGVKVVWGGKTDTTKIYSEGMHTGGSWMWNSMEKYDCREKTFIQDYEFHDRNSMVTGVEIALDCNIDPDRVNIMHTKIADLDAKMEKTLKSAAKQIIPQYTAVELNLTKRVEAEQRLGDILEKELPEIFLIFARIQITDVDIPKAISDLAEQTASQLEKNKLAQNKEAEEVANAAAKVAKAKGNFEAAEYESRTARLMSQPAMLKLKELEVQMAWAQKGVSPFGSNNVFGSGIVPMKLLGGG